jgi:hypothetical protein
MKRVVIVWLIVTGVILFAACSSTDRQQDGKMMVAENRIVQQNDGTISLKIDKAECYHDMVNPASNTAEWNVYVKKRGRYDVWLSSATRDTNDLKYKNSVLLSIRDSRLEVLPVVNRVVQNSTEVSRPYFQADSFIGSLYIQDTGTFNVQIISDKIFPKDYSGGSVDPADETKIVSVSLTLARRN